MDKTQTPRSPNHIGRQVKLYEANGLWKSPTPHDVAIASVDEFLQVHFFTPDELLAVHKYYGNKRSWAIRHLRLSEAERRIRTTFGQPDIILHGFGERSGVLDADHGRIEPKNKALTLSLAIFLALWLACPISNATPAPPSKPKQELKISVAEMYVRLIEQRRVAWKEPDVLVRNKNRK